LLQGPGARESGRGRWRRDDLRLDAVVGDLIVGGGGADRERVEARLEEAGDEQIVVAAVVVGRFVLRPGVEPVDEVVDLADVLRVLRVAIHWLRTGSTVLPSRLDVTVKPVSLRPASADETATTPASSTSASSRLRGVIFCLLAEVARTAPMVRAGCCRNVEIALQKCLAR